MAEDLPHPTIPDLPLIEAQEGLWYAQALDPANPIYMTGQFIDLIGTLDLCCFDQAFSVAVAQTPALRLRFARRGGGPRQWLSDQGPELAQIDVSFFADPEAEARSRMAAMDAVAPDLAQGPLATFVLFRLAPDRHFWYQRIHHLATDGFAFVLFTNRVGEIYSAMSTNRPAPVPFPPLEQAFDDDAAYRASDRRDADRAFWGTELRGLDAVAGPAEGRAVTARTFNRARMDLTPNLRDALIARAKGAGVSWPDLLTVLTAAYLSRVSGEGERVFGLPFMARLGTKAARVPSMWMNVLPFRHDPDPDQPLDQVAKAGAAHLARLRQHGRYRSEQLRRDLRRTAIEARVYGPLINIQPFDMPPKFAGLQADLHILGAGAVDDMTVTFRGDAVHGLSLEIDTNPVLYTQASGRAHLARLAAFLTHALAAHRLADVATVTDAEADWILNTLNATAHDLPDVTLTDLIDAQMRATPDAPAVMYGDRVLSYADLDRRSAALAQALVARGAGPGKVVAVALARSEHLAVALVAILRAGAAYVPLDPENPAARLQALIARTGAIAVLADAGLDTGGMPAYAPADWPVSPDGTADRPRATPDDLAYILFTSGSTGDPKGVMIEHRAIVNRLIWMRDHYAIGADDRILQKTPTTFDVSVWELFLPYLAGAAVVFAPPGAHRDPVEIARLIRSYGITTMHFVPSMLAAFLEAPASEGLSSGGTLRRVFCSGEALSADHRARFHARIASQLHNLYGPTEAAVDVTFWDAGAADQSNPMPIGHPVWNTQTLVLDRHMRLVPPGVRGDLYLGGVQLARGYLARPDLTDERFVPNPYGAGRLYATGDVACLRADGAVLYLGRSDHQVKIRGMRIEPGEIEMAIRETGLVRDCVVIARKDHGTDARLVAYVLADSGFNTADLHVQLAGRLPAHMVPGAVVRLDVWPMTVSGKLDRKALPAPVLSMARGTPPQGPVEIRLATLFREVLHLPDDPGREADFFALGGDSLSAVGLCLRMDEIFGRDPGLGQLFETPTVAGLAHAMSLADEARSGLGPVLPLSRAGAGAPLFILPPAGGLGWCYRRLARAIAPLRPVYALQSPLIEGGDVPADIRTMAAGYLDQIVTVAPGGVIHLAGWSVGGILAQEIAVQAREQGRQVGLVAMLDAYPAECWRAEPEPDAVSALRALLAIAGHDPDAYPDLDSRAAVVAFLRQGGTALGSLPEPVLDAVVRLVTGTNRLIRAHHERPFDGVLTHVRAARDHVGRGFTSDLWAPYAARVDRLDLPMLHAEMVSQPAAEWLGPDLGARMVAAEQTL